MMLFRPKTVLPAFLAAALLTGCDRAEVLPTKEVRTWLKKLPNREGLVTLASGDTITVSRATVDFYRRRFWKPAWSGPDELLPRGWKVQQAIARAHEDGLPREKYGFDVTQRLLQKVQASGDVALADTTREDYLASIDVLLTEGFNRYANDLVSGTLDPNKAGLDWRIPRGKALEERVLRTIIRGTPPEQIVATLRPSIPDYERMRAALVDYYEIAARGGWQKVPEGSALKKGARNPAVSLLRTRLIAGLDQTEAALAQKGAADPTLYDEDLAKAVHHFQERHGIEPDGAVGATTLREINHSVEERIDELKLNLDRWRWLPGDLGERYVMVNIAGFEVEVIDQGRVVEQMNVVVGKPSWKTAVFMDTIEHIVVNPYWNVPPNIYNDEIAPALARDPNYLANNHMERHGDGVRQIPGPWNALGQFKIIFPNKYDIYLHDTPADHLFSRARRDFSHGCIRLERPADMVRTLVRMQTSKNPEDVLALAGKGGERWVKLDRKLPIYILYFTAWVETDGTVRFHHDIYGRDEQLEPQRDKLGKVAMR